jgi:aspartate/methionine/tyrosine aminotransferase
MNYSRTHLASPYMEYAKLHSTAKYNLATSGIQPMTMAELGARLEDLEIDGGAPYGYPAFQNRIAAHCGVPPDCVVTAIGTSFANHLAMAACFEPGDDVLIEHPTYEPLLSTARFLGANVIRFNRGVDGGLRLDLREVERAITPRTRLIALCNLHNPTSAFVDEATLAKLGEVARSVGARVLVDEVYLEAMNPRPLTAFLLGREFVVTNSLTKGYGLGGLRCGWILAEPELARRMWALYDVFSGHNPYPAEALSMIAFDHINRIRGRAQRILAANRPVMNTILRERCDLECDIPEFGTCAAPRLKRGSVDALDKLLREKYDTSIVPGRFFEMPQHFRIGIGADPAMTHEGFRRLAAALDEYGSKL